MSILEKFQRKVGINKKYKHWPGIIEGYRRWLPVSKKTPVITLQEGGTPLLELKLELVSSTSFNSFKTKLVNCKYVLVFAI